MADNPFAKFGGATENPFQQFTAPETPDYETEVIEEMSTPERALVGVGRGFAATGQGLKQLGLKAGESLGIVDPEEIEAYRQQIVEDRRQFEKLSDRSTAAKAGEVIGTIAATAPTILIPGGAAAQLGTRALSTAAGGALGAAAQPVYEEDFAAGKTGQVGTGAAFGFGATIGLDKLRNVMPRNLMARLAKKGFGEGSKITKEGELLSALTEIDMTPAQVSGSKSLSFLENAARQSIFTADEVAKFDKKVARQAVSSVAKLADKISKPVKGAETIGGDVQRAVKTAVDDAVKLRRAAAKLDYGEAEKIAKGAKVIQQRNYLDELRGIIDEFSGVDSVDAQRIVRQAGNMIKKNSGDDVAKTVKDAVATRSAYGNAAKGTGNVFKDIDKSLDRRIADRLHRAVSKDLLDGEGVPELNAALRKANDNYAANSQSIKAIERSPLGRFVGEDVLDAADIFGAGGFNTRAGEDVAKRIGRLHPSEIRLSVNILERANPQVADDLRAFVLRDALEGAVPPPSAGMAKPSLSFNKFISNLDKANWKAYGYKPAEVKQVNRIVKAMERVGDRSGYNWSGTQVQGSVMDALRAAGELVTGRLQTAGATALQMLGLRRISRAMTTPEGRKALMEITKPQLRRNNFEKAVSVIENIGVTGEAAELAEE